MRQVWVPCRLNTHSGARDDLQGSGIFGSCAEQWRSVIRGLEMESCRTFDCHMRLFPNPLSLEIMLESG
jgi:hypothetical protein